jgi:hypothetical protein
MLPTACWYSPFFAAILIGVILSTPTSAQAVRNDRPVSGLIKAFRAADASGERLTDDGWRQAARFFVDTPNPPKARLITVIIGGTGPSGPPWIKGPKTAAVEVRYLKLGVVDALGRFERDVVKVRASYELTFTDTYGALASEGSNIVHGPPEWRIAVFDPVPKVSIKAALNYLKALHLRTDSSEVKGNTATSIRTLNTLQTEFRDR